VDTVSLEVTRIVAGGDGIARDADGRVVFVRGGLPGEEVLAVVDERRKDFSRATAVEIVRPSALRVEAPCPLVEAGCGGCDWQHVAHHGQRRLKADVVADALRRQARLEVEVGTGPDLPPGGHRTTVRGIASAGRFSLRARGTHDPVPAGPCTVAHPLVEELMVEGRFPDGEVVLRAGARTGERLVVVHGSGDGTVVPEGVRVVTDAELRSGTRAWFHEEAAGRHWRISARSFFQARPDGAEALVDLVRTGIGSLAPEGHLVDLYGGVGLFAGAVGHRGHVTMVESAASSVADARVNLDDLDVRVIKSDVARWRPATADVVVADPPRAGLGATGVQAVTGSHASRLVLVSCDPASLGRDAKLLVAVGFELTSATLVDLFPHTSHVEAVTTFTRG
jgi:23S rRNA (uracil1939-C5)-methyltransferase